MMLCPWKKAEEVDNPILHFGHKHNGQLYSVYFEMKASSRQSIDCIVNFPPDQKRELCLSPRAYFRHFFERLLWENLK